MKKSTSNARRTFSRKRDIPATLYTRGYNLGPIKSAGRIREVSKSKEERFAERERKIKRNGKRERSYIDASGKVFAIAFCYRIEVGTSRDYTLVCQGEGEGDEGQGEGAQGEER